MSRRTPHIPERVRRGPTSSRNSRRPARFASVSSRFRPTTSTTPGPTKRHSRPTHRQNGSPVTNRWPGAPASERGPKVTARRTAVSTPSRRFSRTTRRSVRFGTVLAPRRNGGPRSGGSTT
ncbi:hypothetical protein HLASF_0553 [Halanaeroarchaeum sulfurireducens]|uniref:Uncharacterized protein n=1 Tax=Halanaeroarchaeum sulfurireducens TaxID=1604004 RepID=A0A0F7P767_9EURY|nr:hypothetical protein HLASF_0553 [Halanaeroarchaeum sulfurireducens]ALG81452.1 hypothetical protein HLASA_0550 [Halanaeroarchaeum sulfurireducens]